MLNFYMLKCFTLINAKIIFIHPLAMGGHKIHPPLPVDFVTPSGESGEPRLARRCEDEVLFCGKNTK